MTGNIGYFTALTATLMWGLVVIPVKSAKTPGERGIAISMLSGLAVLIPAFSIYLLRSGDFCFSIFFSYAGISIFLSGIFQFPLATMFYYKAIQNAEISVVAPFKCIKSTMVIGIVILLGIETVTPRIIISALTGVSGAVLLTLKTSGAAKPHGKNFRKAIVYAILACIFWSIGDVTMQRGTLEIPAMAATPAALASGAIIYYIWIIRTNRLKSILAIPRRDKACYVIHGLASFAVGYLAFFASIETIGVTKAVIITTAWPVISFMAGIILYKEQISARKIAGVALLLASVYLVVAF